MAGNRKRGVVIQARDRPILNPEHINTLELPDIVRDENTVSRFVDQMTAVENKRSAKGREDPKRS